MKETKWDEEYDVVIAGYGGSGISAAITAHDNGAGVVILEKAPYPAGGQTLSSGCGSSFPTNPEKAAEYLYAVSKHGLENADPNSEVSVVPKEDCLIFMKEMAQTPAWLKSMGVEHGVGMGRVRATYPQFPGANAFGHVSIKGFGTRFKTTMKTQIEKRGINVLFETPAVELIQDTETREIKGVYAESQGKRLAIKARKGVVLATGGFEFDEEMKANYLRPYPLKFCGWPYNTGDGIKMAQLVGADLWHMNTMVGYLSIVTPDSKIAWILNFGIGIWVNKYGKRYTNEELPLDHNWWLKHYDFDFKNLEYADVPSYLIFDETIRKNEPASCISSHHPARDQGIQAYPVEFGGVPEGWSLDNTRELAKGWIMKGDTIEELARVIGGKMDPDNLKEAVDRYNSYCEQGHDPEFGRNAENLQALVTPPFYACTLYPGGVNTSGGPRRNGYGQVLDPFKRVIPRLYSAGELGSICGNIYAFGGLNAGEMLASGRLAGRSAAAMDNWDLGLNQRH